MTDIDVILYKPMIKRLLGMYGLDADAVIYSPDIKRWCEEHGVAENNPFRIGKTIKNAEMQKPIILIRKTISADDTQSVKSAMVFRGLASPVDRLSDDALFVKHLVLHEIAHAVKGLRDETDCDRWAFDRLED